MLKNKKKCDKCFSRFTYTLRDGTIVCRNCGNRYKPTKEEIRE